MRENGAPALSAPEPETEVLAPSADPKGTRSPLTWARAAHGANSALEAPRCPQGKRRAPAGPARRLAVRLVARGGGRPREVTAQSDRALPGARGQRCARGAGQWPRK